MKILNQKHITPQIEVVAIMVEKGFLFSAPNPDHGNGINGQEVQGGQWDNGDSHRWF